MTAHDDFDDIWTQQTSTTEQHPEPLLQVETIDGVEPLDDQFGVDAPKTVPDALYAALFGQPAPTEAELAEAGGDAGKVSPLHTYAILDAAKVTNLPEMLEASGLEHRCLFKGNAYDELKDVAPWVVRLEEGNRFTRNLFTRSDAPWHLWDDEPGIYLRSRGTLDDMWKHFRKFTRVQDENGKWFYFRFWEPVMYHTLVRGDARHSIINASFFGNNSILAVDPLLRCAAIIGLGQSAGNAVQPNAKLLNGDLQLLEQFKVSADNRAIASDIHNAEGSWAANNGMSIFDCLSKVEASVHLARSIGLEKTTHVVRFLKICEDIGDGFLRSRAVRQTIQAGHTPSRLITELEFDVTEDEVRNS